MTLKLNAHILMSVDGKYVMVSTVMNSTQTDGLVPSGRIKIHFLNIIYINLFAVEVNLVEHDYES